MIAIDTNVLLYAHRADSPWHAAARARVREASRRPWAIPWPCIHEFIAIATHPRVFDPPSSLSDARRAVEGWVASPKLALLAETTGYWSTLDAVLRDGRRAPRARRPNRRPVSGARRERALDGRPRLLPVLQAAHAEPTDRLTRELARAARRTAVAAKSTPSASGDAGPTDCERIIPPSASPKHERSANRRARARSPPRREAL